MSLILSERELARIKASVLPAVEAGGRLEKKIALKKKSEERVKNWPNTLEALRNKKESYLKDREIEAEVQRQEIDREEAEIRRKARLDSIQKANDLIYEQTDKMKMLRSQMLYADVISTRFQQIDLKQAKKEQEKAEEVKHHEDLLKRVKKLEEAEKEKLSKTKALVTDIKVARFEQLEEVRRKKEEEEKKVREDGLLMKERAQQLLEEELRNFDQKKKLSAESNKQMQKTNADLKRIRQEMQEKERLAEAARDEQIRLSDQQKVALKRLEKERFEKTQTTRQKLIDRAVEQLSLKVNNESKVLNQQQVELKDKEDRDIAAKAMKLEKDYAEVVASRTSQLKTKQEQIERARAEDAAIAMKARRDNEEGILRDREKAIRERQAVVSIKTEQKVIGDAVNRKKIEDRQREIEQTRFLQSIDVSGEQKFTDMCKTEIEKNVQQGKPVYTLLRALEYTCPPLLAAKTNPKEIKEKEK